MWAHWSADLVEVLGSANLRYEIEDRPPAARQAKRIPIVAAQSISSFRSTLTGAEIEGVSEDADNEKYFAAAVEGSATLIMTGDPDFLTVKEDQEIRVVTPRAFLDLLSG